jgi:hypothetical protein
MDHGQEYGLAQHEQHEHGQEHVGQEADAHAYAAGWPAGVDPALVYQPMAPAVPNLM